MLDTAAYGRALTNVKLTAGKTYEAEYYLLNRTGTNVIMAICVKNTSTSQSGSVTLLKSAMVNAADLKQQNPLAASGTPYSASTSFTGLFPNVARNVTVPNLNPFRLCWGGYNNMDGDPVSGSITANSTRVIDCYNSSEFEDPTNTLPFKRNGEKGNFGVVYAIYCSNANANYIRIKPTRAQEGSYTVKINGIWQSVSATKSTPAKLALSGGHSIWFALTSGNTGDIELQLTQS